MKKNMVGVIAIVAVVVLAGAYTVMGSQKPTDVETDTVTTGHIEKYVEDTAEVKLAHEMPLHAVSAGRIVTLNVKEGDLVHKGDVLALLDQQAVQLQMEDLQAQHQGLEAQYREARKPARQSELSKLTAQVKAAQAGFDDAKKALSNNQALFEAGALSDEAYRQGQTDLSSKEAALLAAQNALSLAKEGLSQNVRKQYEAQLKEVDARMALLEKQKQDMAIVSPVEGVVLTKSIENGSYVQPGMKLFDLGEGENLYLTCDVLVEDISGIHVGTPVRLLNHDLSLQNRMAKVSKIYPTAFTKVSDLGINQKRITVELSFDNLKTNTSDSDLRPGYELTAQFVVKEKEAALTVDQKAVFELNGKSAVFVVEKGVAKIRTLEKGIEGEDRVEVLKGLNPGDVVIVSPDEKIKEGLHVQKK